MTGSIADMPQDNIAGVRDPWTGPARTHARARCSVALAYSSGSDSNPIDTSRRSRSIRPAAVVAVPQYRPVLPPARLRHVIFDPFLVTLRFASKPLPLHEHQSRDRGIESPSSPTRIRTNQSFNPHNCRRP